MSDQTLKTPEELKAAAEFQLKANLSQMSLGEIRMKLILEGDTLLEGTGLNANDLIVACNDLIDAIATNTTGSNDVPAYILNKTARAQVVPSFLRATFKDAIATEITTQHEEETKRKLAEVTAKIGTVKPTAENLSRFRRLITEGVALGIIDQDTALAKINKAIEATLAVIDVTIKEMTTINMHKDKQRFSPDILQHYMSKKLEQQDDLPPLDFFGEALSDYAEKSLHVKRKKQGN